MKKAFTLIELLVVIAIIAILAAILFPVFAQAKAAAKDSVTLSNVKQTGLSMLMYSGDSDDSLPLAIQRGELTVPGYVQYFNWNHSIFPYTKNWDLARHPKLDTYALPAALTAPSPYRDYYIGFMLGQDWGVIPNVNCTTATKNATKYTAWTNWPTRGAGAATFDGFFGSGAGANSGGYESTPSASTSSIPNVSGATMVGEAGGWVGGFDLALKSGDVDVLGYYTTGSMNTLGGYDRHAGKNNFFGFHARKSVGKTSGLGWSETDPNVKIEGRTTYVAFDGSAKTMPYGQLYSRADGPNGKVLRYMTMETAN